jgi:hypothetical protein
MCSPFGNTNIKARLLGILELQYNFNLLTRVNSKIFVDSVGKGRDGS